MACVDTSVWITAFRERQSAQAEHLTVLLDNDEVALAVPVKIELLSGASCADRPRLTRALSGLPLLVPTDARWARIAEWVERAGA